MTGVTWPSSNYLTVGRGRAQPVNVPGTRRGGEGENDSLVPFSTGLGSSACGRSLGFGGFVCVRVPHPPLYSRPQPHAERQWLPAVGCGVSGLRRATPEPARPSWSGAASTRYRAWKSRARAWQRRRHHATAPSRGLSPPRARSPPRRVRQETGAAEGERKTQGTARDRKSRVSFVRAAPLAPHPLAPTP